MSEGRKITQLIYKATPEENIEKFMNFLLAKFENNKVEEVIGYHNHRKISIKEWDESE